MKRKKKQSQPDSTREKLGMEYPLPIGGSSIAGILGQSPWATPRSVYNRVWGLSEPKEGDALYWGVQLEGAVLREFFGRHPEVTRVVSEPNPRGPAIGADWIGGHPDELALNSDEDIVVVEAKTAGAHARADWGDPEDGEAGVPRQYVLQVRWYMMVWDAAAAYIAVLIGGQDYREYRIERSEDEEDLMMLAASKFWHEHVLPQIPPPLSEADKAEAVEPLPEAGIVSANAEAETLVHEYVEAKAHSDKAKANSDLAAERLKDWIAGNLGVKGPGYLATYKPDKNGNRSLRVTTDPDFWAKGE